MDVQEVTVKDLEALPRLARIVFAVRCARLTQEVYRQMGGDLATDYAKVFEKAISLAEGVAAGRVVEGLEETCRIVNVMASGSIGIFPIRPQGSPAGKGATLKELANYGVAYATLNAVRAALEKSADAAFAAFTYATGSARDCHQIGIEVSLCESLKKLQHAAVARKWTDSTPVTEEFFCEYTDPPREMCSRPSIE